MQNTPEPRNPTEVARETIRQLALQRLVPTPDNYADLYSKIAGVAGPGNDADARRLLLRIAPQLPQLTVDKLGAALAGRDWPAARDVLVQLAGPDARRAERAEREDAPNWAGLISGVMRGLEVRHSTLTLARKREGLDHVLKSFGGDSVKLYARLAGLAKSWSDAAHEAAKPEEPSPAVPGVVERSAREAVLEPVLLGADRDAARVLRELLASTLQFGVVARLGYSPALMAEAQELAGRARLAATAPEVEKFAVELKQLWLRLELSGESQAQLMQALLGLVEMVLNNVGELVADDRWLHGQLERLRGLVAGPLEAGMIRGVELGFREVVYKQGTLKHGLDQAKAALKDLLGTFIVRLGEVASHTGDYHDRISKHSERLKRADDIGQLGEILGQVMSDTRGIQTDMLRARDELDNSRQQAQGYERRIVTLQHELEQVSALVREDPLTHVLNRRGFEEAWAVETARCERRGVPICLSVLDVDNFKNINDRLGHVAGDDALVHLAGIVRATLRPSDVVVRYGGEEFVILLPEVGLDEAMQVMVRVQRELTRRFFMYNNEKVLITFSAGVTERRAGEVQQVLVARADAALYEAKRTGKNRVVPV